MKFVKQNASAMNGAGKAAEGAFLNNIMPLMLPWHVSRRLPPADMLRSWPELMGPYLAPRVRPVCFSRSRPGDLVLAVQGAALRQELSLSVSDIMDKFRQAGFAVEGLKFITARAEAPARVYLDTAPSPPSPEELARLETRLAQVENIPLRQALQKFWLRNLAAGG
ncbi:MAG: DUF721 domain-containing protein [Desulfarculales bacterium]|jgi:hypothetical protein|nr:DUF721 domain-containing protein [Desulfarculales bacterium]